MNITIEIHWANVPAIDHLSSIVINREVQIIRGSSLMLLLHLIGKLLILSLILLQDTLIEILNGYVVGFLNVL